MPQRHLPEDDVFQIEPGTHTAFARRILETVASVHRIPPMPTVAISVRALPTVNRNGWFDGTTIVVNRRSPGRDLALVHEIGHALDLYAVNQRGGYASQTTDLRLAEWRDAAGKSSAIRDLRRLQMHFGSTGGRLATYVEYALDFSEVFARGYAQWIALRADSATMLQSIQTMRSSPDLVTPLVHWDAGDFEPVAAAFDRLFGGLGWR